MTRPNISLGYRQPYPLMISISPDLYDRLQKTQSQELAFYYSIIEGIIESCAVETISPPGGFQLGMPLINGCKYSWYNSFISHNIPPICEPCIRGHRATSCAHTDRILIEVRKPGRPLESCGHNLNTCQCGKVAEVFAINDLLPDPSVGSFGMGSNSTFVVTTPPTPVASNPSITKPKSSTKSQFKVTKRPKKKITTPSASPIEKAVPSASSPSTILEHPQVIFLTDDTSQEKVDPHSPHGHQAVYSQPTQYILPNPQQYQPQGPGQGAYMNYPSGPGGHQILYEQPLDYSSRIEDITMGQDPRLQSQQDTHPSEVRSQCIMATQEPYWRAMR